MQLAIARLPFLAAKFIPPPKPGGPALEGSFIFDPDKAAFTPDTAQVARSLYHDCSALDISFAKAILGKQPVAPPATPVQVTEAIYGAVPKYYLVCSEARKASMAQMAQNLTVKKLVTLPTGHSAFFSQPEALIDLIVSF